MPKTDNRRKRRPRFDSLEDRRVPATWGIPWADAQQLTVSFVPDGTSLPGGGSSQLSQTLDSQLGPSASWQTSILKALQTWAANSNINLGVVADGGQPVGVAGPVQGDARFGDIRIAAEPLPADVVAITTPYGPANGSLSGDMILNSNDDFNPADPGSYDLYTIALHEAGHVYGFADSVNPSSFMYDHYQGPQAGLAPGAVTAIQSLYGGPRAIDAIDNTAFSTNPSKPVNIPNPSGGSPSVSLPGDLASAQASNDFTLQAPNATADPLGMDLSVQTAGLSLLAPRVTVYAAGAGGAPGAVVATASASDPLDGGASVHLSGLIAGQKYLVQVQGATGDVFSVGSYDLTLATTLAASGSTNPAAGSHPFQEPKNYDGSTPLTVDASISGSGQVDVYSLKTPASTPNGLTVNLQDWGFGLVAPSITVYDGLNNVVGSATAPNSAGTAASVHVAVVQPNATYFVRVTDGTINPGDFGTYQASASFAPASSGTSASPFVPAIPWFGPKGGGNSKGDTSTFQGAATLQAPAGVAPQSVYDAIDGLSPAQPQQFFKLQTPKAPKGQSEVMTVSVQVLGGGGLLPRIGVLDQDGNALNAQVITEQDGVAVIQVALPSPGDQYVVEVSATPGGGASTSGNFDLNATFSTALAVIGPIDSGTLAASPAGSPTPQASTTLAIGQGEFYSFVLVGAPTNPPTDAILKMTVLDAWGNVVATLATPANQAESMIACLPAGNYTVEVGAYSPSGRAIPGLSFILDGTNVTDPIKGYPTSGSAGGTTGR